MLRAPQAQVDADMQLLDAVAHERTGPLIRLWSNRPCIVVSRRDSRMPDFTRGAACMAAEGWPVVLRGSGGTAVPHGPGVLNISLVYPLVPGQGFSVDTSFQLLCNFVIAGLRRLGHDVAVESVPGAFCDGRYNLVSQGCKIAGTAQQLRRRGSVTAVLSHLSLMVDVDPGEVCERLMRFYALAGKPQLLEPKRVTSLVAAVPDVSCPRVALALARSG